jgi:hypothetical protein
MPTEEDSDFETILNGVGIGPDADAALLLALIISIYTSVYFCYTM